MAFEPRNLQSEVRYFDREGRPTLQMLDEWSRLVRATGGVSSEEVDTIKVLASQAEYDAISPKDPRTLYIW